MIVVKEFNIADARRIEGGELKAKVRMRNGCEAHIVLTQLNSKYPVLYSFEKDGCDVRYIQVTENGMYSANNIPSDLDLVYIETIEPDTEEYVYKKCENKENTIARNGTKEALAEYMREIATYTKEKESDEQVAWIAVCGSAIAIILGVISILIAVS